MERPKVKWLDKQCNVCGRQPKYCDECGQALDWGEEE